MSVTGLAIQKGYVIATINSSGAWTNAVNENFSSGAKNFVNGPWNAAYGGKTYGLYATIYRLGRVKLQRSFRDRRGRIALAKLPQPAQSRYMARRMRSELRPTGARELCGLLIQNSKDRFL